MGRRRIPDGAEHRRTPAVDLPAGTLDVSTFSTRLLRLETALERMSHGVCFFDGAQRLILANRRYAELYDIAHESITPGMPLRDIIALRFAAGSCPRMTPEEYLVWRDEIAERNEPSETVVEMANGRTVMIKHQPMPDGGWVATHEDITEQRRAAEHIAHMAHHDALTGLANRLLFRKTLDEALAGDGAGIPAALVWIDLDRFKQVNDTLGHPLGDLLLRAVAGRLRNLAQPGDLVARLGGDEFALIRRHANAGDMAELARRIIDALGRVYELEGHRADISASVGVALAPHDGCGPDEMMRNADLALYRAKNAGRGCYRFFEPEATLRMQVRRSLSEDLRRGLGSGAFDLHYQPLIEVPSRRIVGYEALLRWRHPERGLVPPQTFIPVAEGAELIVPLGDWAIRRGCEQTVALAGRPKLSVNVSLRQLTPDLPPRLAAVLGETGLDPARLEVEITEHAMLRDTEMVLGVLHGLRNLGVGIAMDGFGTGFSSISALQRFPFTRVKIDRMFVRSIWASGGDAALLRAISDLCKVLKMRITAEGVETEEQFAAVIASGCDEAQGFLFGRPGPLAAAPAWAPPEVY
ncbi:putative bifunctional diguanylate cyclase/phosphodiesterase [Plastoroseomonas arctica]|uniref:EAL domain-containing protein n=1 Tax=Plastoroseomonas arctica TaxID=1509237 RepID=A0AAF1JXD7_9PROT|nr:EAL domain-containing protein [Plastoroseomonas arctica]MBR0656059.1 EAL domain-containing protein [Plastoroseomonas arctica]